MMYSSSTAQNPLTAWLGQGDHAMIIAFGIIIVILMIWRARTR